MEPEPILEGYMTTNQWVNGIQRQGATVNFDRTDLMVTEDLFSKKFKNPFCGNFLANSANFAFRTKILLKLNLVCCHIFIDNLLIIKS
jgi:hypothetical protein